MTTKWCYQHRRVCRGMTVLTLAVCVLLVNIHLCQGSEGKTSSSVRARVFTLNSISANEGKRYLTQLGIGDTVLAIPGTKAISVTGRALDMIRAGTVLSLVDSTEKYLIKKIALKGTDRIPNSQELSRELGSNISIGSFIHRGVSTDIAGAIVDKRGDELVIIATQKHLSEITEAIEHLKNPVAEALDNKLKPAELQPARTVTVPKPPGRQAVQQTKNIIAEVDELPMAGEESPVSYDVWAGMVIPNGEDPVDIDLPQKLEIVQLIELVGKYLNLDYMYDETKVKGHVTVKMGRIKVKDLYLLLEKVLKFNGFVMSRSGNLVTIVPVAEALSLDPTFGDAGIRPGDVVITQVFSLDHVTTDAAKKALVEMKLGANITELKDAGMLIVTAYAFRVGRIEHLLSLIDVPGEARIFKLRELKYTLVTSLVPKLKDMAGKIGTISVSVAEKKTGRKTPRRGRKAEKAKTPPEATKKFEVYIDYDERTNRVLMIGRISEIATVEELIDSLDVPQQDLRMLHDYPIQFVGTEDVMDALQAFGVIGNQQSGPYRSKKTSRGEKGTPASNAGPIRGIDEPQVVEMESTNSLLVNATPEQHIQIDQIISYVDREPEQTSIPYRIYRLEYQEPEELAGTLNEIVEKTIKDEKGKIQKKITREEDIAIIADQKAFSIIVYANKRNQEWIGSLIKTLDKRRPQVLIDVTLVEVTRNEAFQYDLDIISAIPDLDVISGLTTPASLDPAAILSLIAGAPDRNRIVDASSSGGRGRGFYGNKHIQALLTLMQEKGYGRVMAQPQILVNDNEEGKILTTKKTHVREDTQSFPGDGRNSVTTTKWTPYDAKIELTITPQISEGDLLRLQINMIREDFIETIEGPPDYTTSEIDTVVTVPDGSTIILGGLTKLDQTKGGTKVPFFGDIPFVGALFRSVDNVDGERKLYIFVKANILRPDDAGSLAQLKEISRKNRAAFEKAETDFQEYENFPGIKPKIFEPRHVLEQMNDEIVTPEPPVAEADTEPDTELSIEPKVDPATELIESEPIETETHLEPAASGFDGIDSLEMLEGL